jgi:hypothetical protein
MVYREIIAVCSQIHTKHTNTPCGQNAVTGFHGGELLQRFLVAPYVAVIWLLVVRKVANLFLVPVAASKTDFPFVVSVPAEKIRLLL